MYATVLHCSISDSFLDFSLNKQVLLFFLHYHRLRYLIMLDVTGFSFLVFNSKFMNRLFVIKYLMAVVFFENGLDGYNFSTSY